MAMPSAEETRLLIVDGHAYAYRAFHAIRQLSSPAGKPTNAIYGFIKMLGKLRAWLKPSHAAVIWDGGLAAERLAEHPEYKAQRPPMPMDLEPQIDEIINYLEADGVKSLCRDGVEADDWIAAVARRSTEELPVVIASSDKDFMQLVRPGIGLVNPNDKAEKIWVETDVEAKAGVKPVQIVDWLALIGDSVDNIPGVPGVGPKTAAALLKQFGSIDGIFERFPEVSGEKLRTSLESARDILAKNRRLIQLREDLTEPGLDDLRFGSPKVERLRELFASWGFRSMLADLETKVPKQAALLL
jgi:DNA polymerase-1